MGDQYLLILAQIGILSDPDTAVDFALALVCAVQYLQGWFRESIYVRIISIAAEAQLHGFCLCMECLILPRLERGNRDTLQLATGGMYLCRQGTAQCHDQRGGLNCRLHFSCAVQPDFTGNRFIGNFIRRC